MIVVVIKSRHTYVLRFSKFEDKYSRTNMRCQLHNAAKPRSRRGGPKRSFQAVDILSGNLRSWRVSGSSLVES